MSKNKIILTLIGFKITWIGCVMGELYFNSWLGFVLGLTYLLIFFYYQNDKRRSLYIILFFSIAGYMFDSLLSFVEMYKIKADTTFLFLPIWFLILWPSFSSLLVNIFSFLEKKIILSFLIGGILGPVSYYAGVYLGLATVNNFFLTFLLIALFWALLLFFYSNYISKKTILQ